MSRSHAAKTKSHIVDAFWQLYRHKRLEEITIQELMATAGYHRSTFYRHFSRLEEVLQCLYERMSPADGFRAGKLGDGLDNLLSAYDSIADYIQILVGPEGDPGFYAFHRDNAQKVLGNLLEEDNLQHQLAYEYMYAGVFHLLHLWHRKYRDRIPLEDVQKLLETIHGGGFKEIFFSPQKPEEGRSSDGRKGGAEGE